MATEGDQTRPPLTSPPANCPRIRRGAPAAAADGATSPRRCSSRAGRAAGCSSASWAIASGEPQLVEPRLRAAASNEETFYGLLAAETLGVETNIQRENVRADRSAFRALEELPNVRAAVAMAEARRRTLAG